MGLDVWTEKENIGNGWVSGTRYTPWTSQHTLAAFSKNLNTLGPTDRFLASEFLPLGYGFSLLEATVFPYCECLRLVIRRSERPQTCTRANWEEGSRMYEADRTLSFKDHRGRALPL